jgi:putative Mg2+ transporter-C (MgtC) family protein
MDADSVSRILQGLLAGVGFLGAGSILKRESAGRIAGLTTAAGLWLTAGVGMAVGLGRDFSAAVCAVLAFAILWLLGWLEHGGHARPRGVPAPDEGVSVDTAMKP